jgi:hypothetical protein
MPFYSGFAVYFLLLAGLIAAFFRFKESKLSQTQLMIWFALFLFISALPFVIKSGSGIQFFPLLLILVQQ